MLMKEELSIKAYVDAINNIADDLPHMLYQIGDYDSSFMHDFLKDIAKAIVKAKTGKDCKYVKLYVDVDDIAEGSETRFFEVNEKGEKIALSPILTIEATPLILRIYCINDPDKEYHVEKEWGERLYFDGDP